MLKYKEFHLESISFSTSWSLNQLILKIKNNKLTIFKIIYIKNLWNNLNQNQEKTYNQLKVNKNQIHYQVNLKIKITNKLSLKIAINLIFQWDNLIYKILVLQWLAKKLISKIMKYNKKIICMCEGVQSDRMIVFYLKKTGNKIYMKEDMLLYTVQKASEK